MQILIKYHPDNKY